MRWLALCALVFAVGCGEDPAGSQADLGTTDVSNLTDAGGMSDATGVDEGPEDSGRLDTGLRDKGATDDGVGDGFGADFGPGDTSDGGGPPDLGADAGPMTDAGTGDVGSGDSAASDAGANDSAASDSGVADSGTTGDSGAGDSGPFDTGAADTGAADTGAADGGPADTGTTDTGANDAGSDAGVQDAPSNDGGTDAGTSDTGSSDSGPTDAGSGGGGLWIEIDYRNAFTPRSPRWSYSNSPGWNPIDWDFNGGGSGAEAWDRFNNMSVVSDPIGTVLEIGSSSQLQLMFGVVRLTSYTQVLVELQGRSRSCCSQVRFEVTNPALGACGAATTMNQDWTPDIVVVDITPCLTPGSNLQAIRVDPTSGSIALQRMRLTILGAVW